MSNSKTFSNNLFALNKPLIVAVTGASGVVYSIRLLDFLLACGQKIELVFSNAALRVFQEEHDIILPINDSKEKILQALNLPESRTDLVNIHKSNDYGASIASGSYPSMGMIVIPCTLGSLGSLACGLSQNLIHRAGLVTLKERRKLVIVLREMPYGHIQLKHMLALSEAGAVITSASPGFYHKPQTIQDQIDFVVGKVIDLFDLDNNLFKRWKVDSLNSSQA